MKKGVKILIWFLILIVVAIAGVFTWIWYTESDKRDPFSVVPEDAIFIIETTEMTKGWNTINESKIWNHLIFNDYFADINKSALTLDSLIRGNKVLDMLMSDRKLLISAHMIADNDYDFLFVIDLKQASKISFIKNYIKEITSTFGYSYSRKEIENNDVVVLTDNKTKEELYLSFINNILICSYSESIIQKSLSRKDIINWDENKAFKQTSSKLSSRKMFNFYFNYGQLNNYISCFLPKQDELVAGLGNALGWSALNFYFEDEKISFNGYTNLNDSVRSYFKALIGIKPGPIRGYEILSEQTALYISLSFDDFENFREGLEEEFSMDDTTLYQNYSKNVARIDKLLKINLKEDFFGWIGNEIVFSKMRPAPNAREEDVVVAIHTMDTLASKKGLNNITTQVKKRTPAKFEAVDYKNFVINQLVIKGFFKMFLGNLFSKLEKPYFTYIEDYVVFSNSAGALQNVIDDYIKGATLSRNTNFMEFKNNFDDEANITTFILMPKLYSHLYYYSNKEKRKNISKNKETILSFENIGLQLSSDGRMFKTIIIAQHNPDALMNEELEKFESAAEELFLDEYDSLLFKPETKELNMFNNGPLKIKYPDSTLKHEGRIQNNTLNGLWRSYYENGRIKSSVNYSDGMAEGVAIFYYDVPASTIKAEMKFSKDKIIDTYREFYENGARKATLTFKQGLADGNAEFFYKSGVVKIKGEYKNGQKSGKWKYYTETGEVFDREKMRRKRK